MATGYHRLNRKARHLIRQLRRTKNAALQRLHLHELRHAISRRHGFRGPKRTPDLGRAGHFRPLTRRAKQLLTRLRKARVWSVQKRIVNELAREIEKGRYLRDRVMGAAARARKVPERMVAREKRVRERLARGGRTLRGRVQRAHEPHLARAERRQAEREAGKRKSLLRHRLRQRASGWRQRASGWRRRGRSGPQREPRSPRTFRTRPAPAQGTRSRLTRLARPRPARARTR
jgi:hypothetical protein